MSEKKRGRPTKPVAPDTLGGRIRAARERAGLGVKETAGLIGIEHPSLSDIESGKTKNPGGPTLILLARELRDSFGEEWLRPHAASKDLLPLTIREERIIIRFREMLPPLRKKLENFMEQLVSARGGAFEAEDELNRRFLELPVEEKVRLLEVPARPRRGMMVEVVETPLEMEPQTRAMKPKEKKGGRR